MRSPERQPLRLRDLAAKGDIEFSDGYRTRKDQLADTGIPILRVAEVLDGSVSPNGKDRVGFEHRARMGRKVSVPGDVLVTTKGTVGRVARVPEWLPEHVYSPQLCFLRVLRPDHVDPRWLYYYARSAAFQDQVLRFSGQTDMAPYLNLSDLSQFEICLPQIFEQRRVSGVLGALDDLIEVNGGLMKSLRSLISSEYRSVVNGADTVPLFDVFDVDFGAAFKGKYFTGQGEGLPLLRIRDLKTFRHDTWTTERAKGDVLVQPGDIVVGMDAEFRPTIWLGRPCLLNQRVCRIRPRRGSLAFAREALAAPLAVIEGHKTGTTVSHLNKSDLLEIRIPMPEDSALARFDAVAEPMRKMIVALHQENELLRLSRDELLPPLLSGRVTVREASS